MTARKCFTGKIRAGKVSQRAGAQILDMLDAFEAQYQSTLGDAAGARQAALDAAEIAKGEAARKADETRGTIIAQANALRAIASYTAKVETLRNTPGDFGFGNKAPPSLGKNQTPLGFAVRALLARDPFEIASYANVHYLARSIRAEAHAKFAEAIEYLRPKHLGFTAQTARELDVLRALHGRTDVDPLARPVAEAWSRVAERLADQFIAAGGRLAKREQWRLPNPELDRAKVQALGPDRFAQLVRDHADRAAMTDFDTGKPLSDARFAQIVNDAYQAIVADGAEGLPSGAVRGRRMLANSRDFARVFVWKDAESWMAIAESVGTHASVFETMTRHIHAMADDIAMMRVLGPNPEATKRFILDLFDRETARLGVTAADEKDIKSATKANRAAAARVAMERKAFENLYAEISGANRIPVNMAVAQGMADMRHALSAAQMGSAIVSSLTDPGTAAMAARFNGLPVMNVLSRAVQMFSEKGSEVFAAQQGMVMDTLAHAAGTNDRVMGEAIRTGVMAKIASANIRLSGLRRFTALLRASFGLEMMAHAARERGKGFAELTPDFRGALERYGIGQSDWDLIRATAPHEPRPNALFIRPLDILQGGTAAHRAAAEKFARLRDTEMDYAVIEGDPVTRAMMIGASQPGTLGGEVRRSVSMYRSFPATFVMMHFARAFARGWDGTRLSHAALTFAAMTILGAGAMQAKEILAGRDPLSLDPSTANGLRAWGKAMMQGGGFGVFGDILFIDQTRYGNSWAATVAGPVAGAAETIVGDFIIRNIQRAGKGEPSQFAGDALYVAGRYAPGSSLWFSRLAFQRGVLDQAALIADPKARDRFARIEEKAKKEWGQSYWWRPGRDEPSRAPQIGVTR